MDLLYVWLGSARCWMSSIPFLKLGGDNSTLQPVGELVYMIYCEWKTILVFVHVLAAAIFPIYIGSHASLRCPPSAICRACQCTISDDAATEDENNDGLESLESPMTQGLTPSDAILFPVGGACVLTALYFLIKWFEDPSIINKVLGWYFSVCCVFAVGSLVGDTLNVGTSFIFPTFWSSGDQLYYVDQLHSKHVIKSPLIGGIREAHAHRKLMGNRLPFPGKLSTISLPEKAIAHVWTIRGLFLEHWILRCYVHGGIMNIKTKIRLNDILGQLFAIIVIAVYNVNGKAWWLSNLMSFGLCYTTLRLLSPTTFWTGSLVLAGLFVYDIVMVFYTPIMITVATSLDVPIKIVFPGGGMLGLGDIVLPGLMIAIALRFDLYLHYLRQPASAVIFPSSTNSLETMPMYHPATGRWGERYWTVSLKRSALPTPLSGSSFKKTYFHASMVGYIIGMIATYTVLIVFKHGQPALMYLVPTVLFSLWFTAAVRGDLAEMWRYTEDGEMEEGAPVPENGAKNQGGLEEKLETIGENIESNGSVWQSLDFMHGKLEGIDGREESMEAYQKVDDKTSNAARYEQQTETPAKDAPHHVFLFSLYALPRAAAKKTPPNLIT